MKNSAEIFKFNLKRLRKLKFPKQEDFAPLVGFESVRGYQKYEQGESAPTPEILDRFAQALGCDPWELLIPHDVVTQQKQPLSIDEIIQKSLQAYQAKFEKDKDLAALNYRLISEWGVSLADVLAKFQSLSHPRMAVVLALILGAKIAEDKVPDKLAPALRALLKIP